MINRAQLLADLQTVLRKLEADLLERSEEMPEVSTTLTGEHQRARKAERTSQSYEDWRSDHITQIAAAWVLSCVFVRFLEDNHLIDPPKIAGPDERLARARDEHELYFRAHPAETDREYLLHVFDELARLPGARDIFGEHNPIHELHNWLSGDAAGELLRFFQKIAANTGSLIHDFTDPDWNTRFLGDLYQELSEEARKKYALLQTPEFVEEFILDRTLDPAIEEFGLEGFRMIDPACGSGHFLLGSFARLLERWLRKEPAMNVRELVQRALDSVYGVDVNPYAVAIARFRLLLAAMKASKVRQLVDLPAFRLNLTCGDSLLHGAPSGDQQSLGWHALDPVYRNEDRDELYRILKAGHYHAVVANPPYITPKDKALNQAYRDRYFACHGKYSLSVPFLQRIFHLAVCSGFTGQITANSFMKREFGKKLIESFIPKIDLTHIIDTSLAYIPGHGIPTVILLGQNQSPVGKTIRAVMGIKREDNQPVEPALGMVWLAVLSHIDLPGSKNEFVSVSDTARAIFCRHPWSIGGGGAAELKENLDGVRIGTLVDIAETAIGAVTLEDDAYSGKVQDWRRQKISTNEIIGFVEGDRVRDWIILSPTSALFPYYSVTQTPYLSKQTEFVLWPLRTNLANRLWFSKTQIGRGLTWYEYGLLSKAVLQTSFSIIFCEVATHNHFSLDKSIRVYKNSAPVIKMRGLVDMEAYLALLGLLNSSVACFWLRQMCHDKGGGGIGGGIAAETWERFFTFNGTKVKRFPLPGGYPQKQPSILHQLAQSLVSLSPDEIFHSSVTSINRRTIHSMKEQWSEVHCQMVSAQEELDWQCYRLYSLSNEDLTYDKDSPPLQLGQRAFEIFMARQMAAGELETAWFERHGSTPITETPVEWPEDYRRLVERRIELIETDLNLGLIEQPEYKRRWNTEPWDSQLERALRNWLLVRLERYFDFDGRMNDECKPTAKLDIALISIAQLADVVRQDANFIQVGELYRNDPAFDINRLVTELVEVESVPMLPILRYKPSGLRKRGEWEQTWDLQRQEDTIDARTRLPKDEPQYLTELQAQELKRREIGDIPVPPKYTSSDFQSSTFWRLRGKLDVPKERWVSFPHCEGPDGMLMIAWAGYDHLQLARAISTYYVDIQERLGGRDDPRLLPLLACLIELLPWLKQWHNEVDPEFGMHMGDYFEGFIQEEARQMGKTLDQIRAWEPPKKTTRRRKRTAMES